MLSVDGAKEPSWNYQVVRFLDANGKDLIPRKDKVRDVMGLATRMQKALEAAGREVPADLGGLVAR